MAQFVTLKPLSKVFEDAAFKKDAKAIADLPGEIFSSVVQQLSNCSKFMPSENLEAFFKEIIPDDPVASALKRLVWNMHEYLASYFGGESSDLFEEVKDALLESDDGFDKPLFEARLKELIEAGACVARQLKAQRLATATSQTFHSMTIVSDMRPVFDRSKTTVDGVVTVNTLTILVYQDGFPKHYDYVVSLDDLKKIKKSAEEAIQKNEVITTLCDRLSLEVVHVEGE